MRNNHDSLLGSKHDLVQSCLHNLLGRRIECTCGFIEQQHHWAFQECSVIQNNELEDIARIRNINISEKRLPGNSNALLLTT